MRVVVKEDTLARLRMTAREWSIPGWSEMTSTGHLRSAIETAWRREVEAEERRVMAARHLSRLRESRA